MTMVDGRRWSDRPGDIRVALLRVTVKERVLRGIEAVVAGAVLSVRVSTRGPRHAGQGRGARLLTEESDLRVQIGQEQATTDGAFRSASPLPSTVSGMAIAGTSLGGKILSISVAAMSGLVTARKADLWGWLEKGRLGGGRWEVGGDTEFALLIKGLERRVTKVRE